MDSLLLRDLLVLGAARLHIPVREEEQIRKLDQAGDEHLRLLGILDSGELQLQDILDLEEHLGIPDAEGELLLLGILDQVELQPLDILDQLGLLLQGNLPGALGILTFFPYVSSTNRHRHRWSFVNYICV